MLRFLADENFNNDIVRGLLAKQPSLDLLRVQDVGLAGATDPQVLSWCVQETRILLTHDVRTIPAFAGTLIRENIGLPGVICAKSSLAIGRVIDDLELIATCADENEIANRVIFLPLA